MTRIYMTAAAIAFGAVAAMTQTAAADDAGDALQLRNSFQYRLNQFTQLQNRYQLKEKAQVQTRSQFRTQQDGENRHQYRHQNRTKSGFGAGQAGSLGGFGPGGVHGGQG